MNWTLFLFVVAVGVSTGTLFRRRQLTRAETWSLVGGRIAVGLVLATVVSSDHNSVAFLVLGASEVARALEFVTGETVDRLLVRLEARKWLLP